ncbi:hypothetical protein D3C71_1763670 [compost metagenome]
MRQPFNFRNNIYVLVPHHPVTEGFIYRQTKNKLQSGIQIVNPAGGEKQDQSALHHGHYVAEAP